MFSGINSVGTNRNTSGLSALYQAQSQMNNMRLMQALAGKNSVLNSGSSSSSASKGTSISSDSMSFLKEYQNKMTDMMNSANALRSDYANSGANALAISSGNTDVLEVSAKYRLTEAAQYTVNVEQLATEQINFTNSLESTANSELTGTLSIAVSGRADPIEIDIGSVSGATNEEKLNNVAKLVNLYHAGVTGEVVRDGDKSVLMLYSDQTGKGSGFVVSGSFAESSGLDRVEQQADDAVYTVDKAGDGQDAQRFTSSDNTVSIGGYRIEAELKKEGTSVISTGPDIKKTASAMQDLVDSYNSALKFLSKNEDRGTGVLRQMKRMITPPTSESSMKLAGITIKKDGTLSLDQDAFKKAMEKNPSLVKDIVSGSHGIANGIYNDAKDGMKASSASLLDASTTTQNSLSSFQNSLTQNSNALSYMSAYSKSGVYNMLNFYSVGALMNINI